MRGKLGIYSSMQLYDPDAAAYIAAVEFADGQALEAALKNAINDFVVGLKSDGIWNEINSACILMGARTLSGALIPLKGTAPTSINFVSGDYNRTTGLIGNGSTKYLDTNVANSVMARNNNHHAVYNSTIHSNAFGNTGHYMASGLNATGTSSLFRAGATGQHSGRNKSSTSTQNGLTTPNAGFYGNARSVSASYIQRTSSTDYTVSVASQTSNADNIWIFSSKSRGSPAFMSNGRTSFYSFGGYVTLTNFETRVNTLVTAIAAAIP
jgi:hypothetical protein